MLIILIGPPGAGKGTQAEYLKQTFEHISTGNLFRKALREQTPLGIKAKEFIDTGKLVPDSLTVDLVKEALLGSDTTEKPPTLNLKEKNILLDGFPRNLYQAKALEDILKETGLRIDKALFLEAPDSVVIERLSGRRYAPTSGRVYHIKHNPPKKPNCCDESGERLVTREDDQKEVILKRLKIFKTETAKLWDFYTALKIAKRIPATDSPDKIFESIKQALNLS